MKFLIAGDLVPTKNNIDMFKEKKIDDLLGEDLKRIWKAADFKVFNLEVPLADIKSPILKLGPNLISETSTINGIKELNPSLVTLANNHILDQGEVGFVSTLRELEKAKIPYIGVGKNIKSIKKYSIIEKNNIKFGVYACTETEFSIATENKSGANPFDILETFKDINDLKKQCDYVIVLYHGGKEHYRYPSPYLRKISRKMCENGADIIVMQHSHTIGCYENYNESTIVYGQGNFIFDMLDNEYWNTSLIIELSIDKKNKLNIDYIPIRKNNNGIILANDTEKEKIMGKFELRSKEIQKEKFVENKYNEFSLKELNNYLYAFSGFNKWVSRIDRYLLKNKLLNKKMTKNKLLTLQNFIECEAHRELLLNGLKEKIKSE